jgi:hypothetical protein
MGHLRHGTHSQLPCVLLRPGTHCALHRRQEAGALSGVIFANVHRRTALCPCTVFSLPKVVVPHCQSYAAYCPRSSTWHVILRSSHAHYRSQTSQVSSVNSRFHRGTSNVTTDAVGRTHAATPQTQSIMTPGAFVLFIPGGAALGSLAV